MTKMVNNKIYCGGGGEEYNVGQRVQVGLFSCYASPQPGLCAGTEGMWFEPGRSGGVRERRGEERGLQGASEGRWIRAAC